MMIQYQTLNRLVGTAATDRSFCQLLLRDPVTAAMGFGLLPEELQAVAGIRATSLVDFARQLDTWMLSCDHHNGNGNGNGRGNGSGYSRGNGSGFWSKNEEKQRSAAFISGLLHPLPRVEYAY